MSNKRARSTTERRKPGPNRRISLDALSFASSFFEAIDTPRSLSLWLLVNYQEFEQVARFDFSSDDYLDNLLPNLGFRGVAEFCADSQCASLLSKYEELATGIDTELAAKKKFISAEQLCKSTNEYFRNRSYVESPRACEVLHLTQQKIASILGDVPSYEELAFKFGPGGNYGISGDTSQYRKLISGLECTNALAGIMTEFLGQMPGWFDENQTTATVSVVSGSRLTFVPKNAKTDRPICIEPCLNTMYQKGIGGYIRDRLRKWGVDLRDQTLNQELARVAVFKDLVTVDFASASDTISYNLVYDLLPLDWAEFLDVGRSPNFEIDGRVYPFQKFSSMGNAYTFELESLIFFALAISCCEVLSLPWATGTGGNLAVYGDDVVLPSRAFTLFSECAVVCGFEINVEKSCVTGLFFESCGKDYFNGTDVRPFFIKKCPSTRGALGVYYVANQLKRWTERFISACNFQFASARVPGLLNVYWDLVDHIPSSERLYGPEGYGDGHFVSDATDYLRTYLDAQYGDVGWDGGVFDSLVAVPIVILPDLTETDPVTGRRSLIWPNSYALYTSAYGDARDAVLRQERALAVERTRDIPIHEYAARFDVIEAAGLSCPQFSKGYMVRDRVRVKRMPIYVSR